MLPYGGALCLYALHRDGLLLYFVSKSHGFFYIIDGDGEFTHYPLDSFESRTVAPATAANSEYSSVVSAV